MDKKMVCGIMLTIVGLVFSALCFIYAAMNPWDYDGITGLLGSFLGTRMLTPFIFSTIIMLAGLALCFWIAFQKAEH